MKFQSYIAYPQECFALLCGVADGSHGMPQYLKPETLPQSCQDDLAVLSAIARQAVDGLSQERIEFYFKKLNNRWECIASLLGCFDSIHALDDLTKEEARFDTLTLPDRLEHVTEASAVTAEEKLADYSQVLQSLELEDSVRWNVISALLHPEEHKEAMFTLLRHVQGVLVRHEEELNQIFQRCRDALIAEDQKKPLEELMAEMSTYQLDSSIIPNEMAMLLFDGFSMRGQVTDSGQAWFMVGAFLPYHAPLPLSKHKLDSKQIIAFGKLFSDASKLEILKLLSRKPCINREIAQALKLSAATISYHMAVLTEMELVNTSISANKVIYELNRENLSNVMEQMTDYFQNLDQQI